MPHVVVVGSGFAGCTAIRTLRKEGHRDSITLVSPQPELFFYPSLIWVPAGRRTESDLRIDISGFLRKHGVEHHAASATGLDPEKRVLHTDAGNVSFDYLIIACGGRYIRKLPGIEHAHVACSGWEATRAFSDGLASLDGGHVSFGFAGNPKEPSAMRGGPVFEFLFGVDTLLRGQGRRERFTLHFFSPAPRPGARMGEKAVDRLLGEMARRGVRTHLGHKMKSMGPASVATEAEEFQSDLTLFMPGMTGPQWAADSGLPLSEGGFLQADDHCRSTICEAGVHGIYVAGDAGSFPGPDWKPKQAHMADLQAEAAARNLLAHSRGRPESHGFRTELLCIVDSLDNGTLVYRGERRSFHFRAPPMHWAKGFFEWHYLRTFRNAA